MKLWFARSSSDHTAEEPSMQQALEFTWNAHQAVSDWSARLDTKSSILLSLETAATVVVVAATETGHVFARLQDLRLYAFRGGLGLLLISIALAAFVVFPKSGQRKVHGGPSGIVYYGDVRRWDAYELYAYLSTLKPQQYLKLLTDQLVTLSRYAWKKHLQLRASMFLAALGAILLLSAIYI
jgi:hypothetical protein